MVGSIGAEGFAAALDMNSSMERPYSQERSEMRDETTQVSHEKNVDFRASEITSTNKPWKEKQIFVMDRWMDTSCGTSFILMLRELRYMMDGWVLETEK